MGFMMLGWLILGAVAVELLVWLAVGRDRPAEHEVARRVEEGYEILDRQMLDMAIEADCDLTDRAEFCAITGDLEPMPEHADLCTKCLAPLNR